MTDSRGRMTGYVEGPTLELYHQPFNPGWEQDPRVDDGHAHQWEGVVVCSYADRLELVIRCALCLCPRCGHSDDEDPCMERRHHDNVHLTLHGRFEPVGGYLQQEEQ